MWLLSSGLWVQGPHWAWSVLKKIIKTNCVVDFQARILITTLGLKKLSCQPWEPRYQIRKLHALCLFSNFLPTLCLVRVREVYKLVYTSKPCFPEVQNSSQETRGPQGVNPQYASKYQRRKCKELAVWECSVYSPRTSLELRAGKCIANSLLAKPTKPLSQMDGWRHEPASHVRRQREGRSPQFSSCPRVELSHPTFHFLWWLLGFFEF